MQHKEMSEKIACEICGKPKDLSHAECYNSIGKRNPLCNEYHRCRIDEKTKEQFDYVFSDIDKNIFLKACPGSGKTEVVGVKAAYEIKKWDKDVGGIAVLTFTNNAADEISKRVSQFLGTDKTKYPHFIGTFDSWLHGYIAHPFGHLLTKYEGKNNDHSIRIVDDSQTNSWLNAYKLKTSYCYYAKDKKGKIKYKNEEPELRSIPLYVNNIRKDPIVDKWYIKNLTSTNEWVEESEFYESDAFKYFRSNKTWLTLDCMRNDFDVCKKNFLKGGFATYQDIEFISYMIVKNSSKLREKLALRFPLIIVDECQDLSAIQLEILGEFQKEDCILHFIGDTNQAIYNFKGVNPDTVHKYINSANFVEKNINANFRSCQPIVDACQKIINNKDAVQGSHESTIKPNCIYITYKKDDMCKLPEIFCGYLNKQNIPIDKSSIIARSWSTIKMMRPSRDDGSITKYQQRLAMAIYLWKSGSIQAIADSINYMGMFMAEKFFPKYHARSNSYHCPECVESSVAWRIFLMEILDRCVKNDELINFDSTGSIWAESVRQNLGQIVNGCKDVLKDCLSSAIHIPTDLVTRSNKGSKVVQIVFTACSAEKPMKELLGTYSLSPIGIKITTIHSVKGQTFDAIMLVSSPSTKGSTDNHCKHWLADHSSEAARLAYVASSRPKDLLVWAVPEGKDTDLAKLESIGFSHI